MELDYDIIEEEEFYVPSVKLENAFLVTEVQNPESFDPLEFIDDSDLYMELVNYRDFRKAVSRGYKACMEDICGYESYEDGKSVAFSSDFELDDTPIKTVISVSKAADNAPYVLSIDVYCQ